jgi:hypothetical protein
MHIKFWSEKGERKRQFGRYRSIREDNIRRDLRETGWKVVDLTHLAENRAGLCALAKAAMNLRVPKKKKKWGIS